MRLSMHLIFHDLCQRAIFYHHKGKDFENILDQAEEELQIKLIYGNFKKIIVVLHI